MVRIHLTAVGLLALFVLSTTATPLLTNTHSPMWTDSDGAPQLTASTDYELELGNPAVVPFDRSHWPASMTVPGWPAPNMVADFDDRAMLHAPGNQPVNNDGLTYVNDRFDRPGRALQVDSQSLLKYRLDDTSGLVFGDGEAHTLSFWMNIERFASKGYILYLEDGWEFYYGGNNVNGRFMVHWQDNATRKPFFAHDFQQAEDVERWLHVALSTDGSNTHLFIDGEHAASYLYSHNNVNNASDPDEEMSIGRRFTFTNNQARFAIDDLQMVDMALTNETAPLLFAAQSVAWQSTPPLPEGLRWDGMRATIEGVPTAGGISTHEIRGQWTENGTVTSVNTTFNLSVAPVNDPLTASLVLDDRHRTEAGEGPSPFFGYRTTVGAPVEVSFDMVSWQAGPDHHHAEDQTVAIPFETNLTPTRGDLRVVNQTNVTMVEDRQGRSGGAVRIEAGGELAYNVTAWNEVAFRDNQDIAISFWMRMDSNADANTIVRHHGDEVTAWSLTWDPRSMLDSSPGDLRYHHVHWNWGTASSGGGAAIPSPDMTEWHHVVWTKNEGYMRHFIDGGRQGIVHTNEDHVYWNESTLLTFGGGEGAIEIDEFRVWNRSIPEERVVDITRLRTAATYSVTPPLPEGLTVDQGNMSIVGSATAPLEATTFTLLATWNESLWGSTASQQFTLEVSGEPDADLDGVPDEEDAFPDDPAEQVDQDGDGVGDNADAFPDDAAEQADTDGDGVGDNNDADPLDANETRTLDDVTVNEGSSFFDPLSDPTTFSLLGCGLLLMVGLLAVLFLKRSRPNEVAPSLTDGSKTVFELPAEQEGYGKNIPELIDSNQKP